ncbi:MAG: BrnT family toxin [Opitutales bacterium]|nr:BrnT family toxin [Opitutales bacterium]
MFEFDPAKSRANRAKHGLDFIEAQKLWEEPTLAFSSPHSEEPRTVVVGLINEKFWSAIITYRHEKIRIISVRRSRQSEIRRWQDHHQPGRQTDD